MHSILYHSQSAHTSNKKPMGKTISLQLSCRLDWIFVGIFLACKNPVFAPTQRRGTHSNQTNGNFTLSVFSLWIAVCGWRLHRLSAYGWMVQVILVLELVILHVFSLSITGHSVWEKQQKFRFSVCVTVAVFSCPFLQMFQTNNFTTATVISQRILARSCYDSNEPRAHTLRMDKWNNTCMGRAARGKRKTKGKVVCLVLGFLKSARKCHKFAFITHFCCWI